MYKGLDVQAPRADGSDRVGQLMQVAGGVRSTRGEASGYGAQRAEWPTWYLTRCMQLLFVGVCVCAVSYVNVFSTSPLLEEGWTKIQLEKWMILISKPGSRPPLGRAGPRFI